MAIEIERKFLVKGDFKPFVSRQTNITQGYLSSVPGRTVRVRIRDNRGFLTIKGMSNTSGVSRFEWEKEISLEDAKSLLELCEAGIITKTRFIVPEENGLNFEVDEFYGDNKGLILAEIELPTEDFPFTKPDWLGKEVSGDRKYYNSMLAKNPYKNWQ